MLNSLIEWAEAEREAKRSVSARINYGAGGKHTGYLSLSYSNGPQGERTDVKVRDSRRAGGSQYAIVSERMLARPEDGAPPIPALELKEGGRYSLAIWVLLVAARRALADEKRLTDKAPPAARPAGHRAEAEALRRLNVIERELDEPLTSALPNRKRWER